MFNELCGYKLVDMSKPYMLIDSEIAESKTCPKCNCKMHYEGYTMGNPLVSYRAFAVCSKCGYYEEF